ncbi:MAG: sigma-70 family RNA polymerase sigma factor, partial [Planctomycetota bacterium]
DEGGTAGLVDAARRGDSGAFEQLFRRFRRRLTFWIAVKMGPVLRARSSEDDVLQETFVQAHGSLDRFEDRGAGSFYRWLLSIARNRLRDLHKYHAARKRDPAREVAPARSDTGGAGAALPAAGTSPSSGAGRKELVQRLVEGLDLLPAPLREVVTLRAVEERTFKEIGEHLGKSPATAQVLYGRALEELRRRLGHGPGR